MAAFAPLSKADKWVDDVHKLSSSFFWEACENTLKAREEQRRRRARGRQIAAKRSGKKGRGGTREIALAE